ncbi:MAG: hypothetical protein WBC29_01915 [Candidatus Moraniibacteriota bacterium]
MSSSRSDRTAHSREHSRPSVAAVVVILSSVIRPMDPSATEPTGSKAWMFAQTADTSSSHQRHISAVARTSGSRSRRQ